MRIRPSTIFGSLARGRASTLRSLARGRASTLFVLALASCGSDPDPLTGGGGLGGGDGGAGGGGSGSGSGGDGGGGSAANNNGGACEVRDIDNGRRAPDMLIVLDRSGSMKMAGVNRWDPSVSALKAITKSLDDSVQFGLMTFPAANLSNGSVPVDCQNLSDPTQLVNCLGNIGGNLGRTSCEAGTVNVPVGVHQASAIGTALDAMQPAGATPTAASLSAAHTALGSGLSNNVDVQANGKYVLLVTDGQPNCSGGNTGNQQDPQAVTDSVAAIRAMNDDGIKTYVLGYGTQNDAAATDALNQMAQAGGTGDQNYRPINDEASLLAEFQKITGFVVSCEFTLNAAPPDPTYVLIKLDGTQLNLDDANGWSISPDRLRVTVLGSACEALKSSASHTLSVRVECDQVTLR